MSKTNSQVVGTPSVGNNEQGNAKITTTVNGVLEYSATVIDEVTQAPKVNSKTGEVETVPYFRVQVNDVIPAMVYNATEHCMQAGGARYLQMGPSLLIAKCVALIPGIAYAEKVDRKTLNTALIGATIEFEAIHHNIGDEYTDTLGNTRVYKTERYDYDIKSITLSEIGNRYIANIIEKAITA